MTTHKKTRKALLALTMLICGVGALFWLRWTPSTFIGMVLSAVLFVAVGVAGMALSKRNDRDGKGEKRGRLLD